ncbi:hypothetical protein [Embleya sp. NPDC001921]
MSDIEDAASFRSTVKDPNEIAALYFYQQLDCLFDLATRVSHDFFERPHLYVRIGTSGRTPTLAEDIAGLRTRLGSDPDYLSKVQRDTVHRSLFGSVDGIPGAGEPWAGDGDFFRLRDALLDASAAFAERVFNEGVKMLRERVRSAHRPFGKYLSGLHGASVQFSAQSLGNLAGVAHDVLRDAGVAAVFGIDKAPDPDWPYAEDANADKLVEAVSTQLRGGDYGKEAVISRERISNRQRVALRGAEALAAIVTFKSGDNDTKLSELITKCYTWRAALQSLEGGGPARSATPSGDGVAGRVSVGDAALDRVGRVLDRAVRPAE